MSYPPLSGYGSYYENSSNQSGQKTYGSSRQTSNTPYGQNYSGSERQLQYPSPPPYDWQGRRQQDYPSNSQQSYDAWREANGQNNQDDYRRDSRNYATQAAAGYTQNYYDSTTSAPATSTMAGLNHLAYASGLDNQRSVPRSQQSSSKYLPASTISKPNRVQSPAQDHQRYGHQSQHSYPAQTATTHAAQEMTLTTATRNLETASPNLILYATQALAGAVSLKNQSSGSSQQSTSPALNTTSASQQLRSSYTSASSSQAHGRAPAAQSQQNSSKSSTSAILTLEGAKASSTPQAASANARTSGQAKPPPASQSSSISSLVTLTPETTPSTLTMDAMPSYINPTQVFNPFYKEHERKRRDAAKAEARKKEEAAAAADKPKQAQIQAQTQKQKAASNSDKLTPTLKASAVPLSPPANYEDDMATEMKAMMEKMKAFRQKAPGTFQKLWEEMRKPGAATSASPTVQSPSPQIVHQQGLPPSQRNCTTPEMAAATAPVPGAPATDERLFRKVLGPQGPKSRGPKPIPHAASVSPHAQANGYKVVVQNNEQGLPDLGRFPAERRIRAFYPHRSNSGTSQMPASSSGPFPKPGLATSGSPVEPRVTALAGTVPVPLPAQTASGGVEWPREKRDALAKAAIAALKGLPENASVEISSDDIHAMLEQNPSYIQLCDLLEKKGLKFHRGHFARQLLTSVPDLLTPQKPIETHPPAKGATPATASPAMMSPPLLPRMATNRYPPPPTGPPTGLPVALNAHSYPPVAVYGPPPPHHVHAARAMPPMQSQFGKDQKQVTKVKKAPMPPAKPEPAPGSKEAMARKRDFSELVDLTQLSDNDDYVLSSKHPRLDSPSPEPDPFEKYQLEANMQPPFIPSNLPVSSNSIGMAQVAPLKFSPVQKFPATTAQDPPPLPQPKKIILAKPVNTGEALRKSYYDPKTVARDVLIAAGRHPQERPLNAHLASLLGKHIDLDSDLSTLDWEAIDPGGPPMPRVEYMEIPAAPPRFHPGQHTGGTDGKQRDQARGEAGKTRLPDSETREPGAADSIIARAPPNPQFGKLKLAKRRGSPPSNAIREYSQPSRLRDTQVVDDASSPARALSTQPKARINSSDPPPKERSLRSSSHQLRDSMEPETPGAFFSGGKRRGRPPGSKNKQISVDAVKKFAKPAPLRPQVEVEALPIPQTRPVFKCRWRNCKTELHNLDTLRKHIARVHRPSEEEVQERGLVCWWRKCEYLHIDEEDNIEPTRTFATAEEWMEHISEDHLHRIAMKLGDGPNTSQIDLGTAARTSSYTDSQTITQDKTRYLADEQQRNTTPSVSKRGNRKLPQDAMAFTKPVGDESEAAAQKAFMKAHRPREKMGPKNAAEEMLRAMAAKKAKIGPGIDRGGCTLVGDARRATFVQNPGIRRVVDADY